MQCLCCYIDDDCISINMFHNLSKYVKYVAVGYLETDNHTKCGSLQIKRSNLVAFLNLQIFVPVRFKTRTFYGHNHSL